MHGVVGKRYPIARSFKYASMDEGRHIAMNSFDIAADTAGHLADRQLTLTCHGMQDFPSFGGQHFPEQFNRCERNERALRLALKSGGHSPLGCLN
ncbi:hypothetical protein RhoFW510T8_09660 [Rhodanobacter sp. FW510-T8]|nr:hypothetical protein RhoFW510T8_09660 [Rhodanobacter sp. FW510-T8]